MSLEDSLNDISKKYCKDIKVIKKDFTREITIINKLYPFAKHDYRFRLGLFLIERLYENDKYSRDNKYHRK
jgi:hypothetical protein